MAKQIDRRSLLKTAGATAALAGFGLSAPAVHSANEKVVVKTNNNIEIVNLFTLRKF